jgi:hypothetical protein
MSNLTINNLSELVDLNRSDLREVVGGWIRRTYSTADLHKSIYGKESPYGRIPVSSKYSTAGYRSFFGYTSIG